jgi:hypothetical protein
MSKTNAPVHFGYKTRQEIADEYHLGIKAFMKKLAEKSIKLPPGRVSPRNQKRIYEAFGYPPTVSMEDYKGILTG